MTSDFGANVYLDLRLIHCLGETISRLDELADVANFATDHLQGDPESLNCGTIDSAESHFAENLPDPSAVQNDPGIAATLTSPQERVQPPTDSYRSRTVLDEGMSYSVPVRTIPSSSSGPHVKVQPNVASAEDSSSRIGSTFPPTPLPRPSLKTAPSPGRVEIGSDVIYERPPSLDRTGLMGGQRQGLNLTRSDSFSSLEAKVEDYSTSPVSARLALSADGRKYEKPRRRATNDDRLKKDAEARRRKDEADHRRREEEERQARIERGRLAESDRRQSARKLEYEAARLRDSFRTQARNDILSDSSRERQRQATLSALERDPDEEEYDLIQPYLDEEEAQMEREREHAAARLRRNDETPFPYPKDRFRRESLNDLPIECVNDQLRRDAEARARYQARLAADRTATRPQLPVVHQYPSARHSGTIPQRGADIIARAQARGPKGLGNLNDSFANLNVSNDEAPETSGGQYYEDQRRKRTYP